MAREIKLPDIGDFKDVPIIEIHIKPGQTVAKEEVIFTLESDKATLDVPSPEAGTIGQVLVKVGDKVSQGTLLATLEGAAGAPAPAASEAKAPAPAPAAAPAPASAAKPAPAPAPEAAAVKSDIECDVVVLGAGPGGYTAAFRAADLGQKVVIIDKRATLGGVCLNVGCIPSKALLHAAKTIDEAASFSDHGLTFAPPKIDLDKLRGWKQSVVNRLTGGLTTLARQRKVTVVSGEAKFSSPRQIVVSASNMQSSRPVPSRSRQASSPRIRASSTRPARSTSSTFPSVCWCWAAASSGWKWRPSIIRWDRKSPSSN
jgi:dihydrolipoamide dehydrogenase